MRRASDEERSRLNDTFAALCRVASPSGRERACADLLIAELENCGFAVEEDDAAAVVGANAGNLLAHQSSAEGPAVMLCAHMDTVPLTASVEPVIDNGTWINANPGILGADNKAAVAVLLALARRFASQQPPHVSLELVFTISEETGLRGASAFDVGRLRSRFGFVFDHASPIGEVIVASPSYQRVEADFLGQSAHAGLRPEAGRSAIAAAARAIAGLHLGRLDPNTTVNVGTIAGGTATNVVPERCRIEAEVRGFEEDRIEEVLTDLLDRLQDAADAGECDLDTTVERVFVGYRVDSQSVTLALAERALSGCGYHPRRIASGGGSDANAFIAAGFPCLNVANGTERNHEPDERVAVDALEGMLEVAIALVDECERHFITGPRLEEAS